MAAALLMAGCVKGPETERLQVLDPNLESIVAPFFGAEYVLEINSNTAWKLSKGEGTWYTLAATEFVGTTSLPVNVLPNEGDERRDVITLTSRDGSVVKEIPVIQQGASSEGYLSVSAVREMEGTDARTISGTASKVKGFVITDKNSGNWDNASFAIEDRFADPNCGLTVNVTAEGFTAFNFGEEVEVELDGSVLKRDESGRLVLETSVLPAQTATTPLSVINPVEITPAELAEGDYESMYVKVKAVQVQDETLGGSVLSVSPVFVDEDENKIKLVVSEEAVFAYDEFAAGEGTLAGIAGPASATPTITPVSSADVALTTLRFGAVSGITELPYVFSFYCSEFAGKDVLSKPEYVDVFPLTYDNETSMVKGIVAQDKDLNNGAFLEMAAFGNSASDIGGDGPRMESDITCHDYIKCTGFVSLNCKTTPTEECGWYFTLPLKMELPKDFTVTFGLGSNKYSLGDWDLHYSLDKKSWTKVDRASNTIVKWPDHYGMHFFDYTMHVHLDAPVPSKSNIYLKIVPYGDRAADDKAGRDGHGASCYIWLHSGIIISQEVKGNTDRPAGAVYFEPFDNLVGGVDYFLGDKIAAFDDHSGKDMTNWTDDQKNGLAGENVHERPGYAQIGFVQSIVSDHSYAASNVPNLVGKLTTPALGQAGNLKLSFKAAAFKTNAIRSGQDDAVYDVGSPDITFVVVEVVGGGTINGQTKAVVTNLPTDKFGEFKLDIAGATAATQLTFTSAPEAGQYSRWFIDEILVTQ